MRRLWQIAYLLAAFNLLWTTEAAFKQYAIPPLFRLIGQLTT